VPEEGLGFYENAHWAGNLPRMAFRRAFAVPMDRLASFLQNPPSPNADMNLFLYAGNPDISRNPVKGENIWEEKLLRRVLPRSRLEKNHLPVRQLQDVKVLTFQPDGLEPENSRGFRMTPAIWGSRLHPDQN
jgi:hypothetical protein